MRIAMAQINTRAGDFAATAERMIALSETAAHQGADLLVFPLAALTGPMPPEYASLEGFLIDLSETLVTLSESIACPCIVPVVTDLDGDPCPEAMLLQDGEIRPLRMLSLARQEGASANDAGQASSSTASFEFDGMRFGMAFSYDDMGDLLESGEDVDVVLYVSGYGYALDDPSASLGAALLENRYKNDAIALDAWLVAIGSVGGYGMQVYSGSSFVLSPDGELVASAPAFDEALLLANIDPNERGVEASVLEPEIYNRSLHLWEALSLGLRDLLSKNGISDVALLLDGSLGSCVLATLASDAIGPTHVHALLVPDEGGVANRLASSLRIDAELGDGDVLEAVHDGALRRDVCQALLAQLARKHDALPISSEDKTFMALEATRDHARCSSLAPLGDVYRSDVLELAHLRNTVSPVIPREAFLDPSLPQELLGDEVASEAVLRQVDVALSTHLEWERPLSDVVARQDGSKVAEAALGVLRDHDMGRMGWPPYLIVSSRTLADARMPMGLAWRDRVRSQDERLSADVYDRVAELLATSRQGNAQESHDEQDERDFKAFLDGLGVELAGGALPKGIASKDIENSLGSLFGLLQDLAQSGGLTIDRSEGQNGPLGPLTWGSPFSEN